MRPLVLALAILSPVSVIYFGASNLRGGEMPVTRPDAEVVQLHVSPAAEPIPALKYGLRPSFDKQTVGNAADDFRNAIAAFERPIARGKRANQPSRIDHDLLLKLPLEKATVDALNDTLQQNGEVLQAMDAACWRKQCDWNIRYEVNGLTTLLPDLQAVYNLSPLLLLKARSQLAHGNRTDAMATVACSLKLSRDLGNAKCFSACSLAARVANKALDQLEELVQQPDAPNLYWAVADLPNPFINMRGALDVERNMLQYTFPEIRRLRSGVLTKEESRKLTDQILKRWISLGLGVGPSTSSAEVAWFQFSAAAMREYPSAKRALVESGWNKAEVETMPAEQVIWLDSLFVYEVHRDAAFKWMSVSGSARWKGIEDASRAMAAARLRRKDRYPFDFIGYTPNVLESFYTAITVQRRVDLLRIVEAIRLYAASHKSGLPNRLDEISQVPIPLDPLTEKAFDYQVDGQTAVLGFNNDAPQRRMGRSYRIQLHDRTVR